MTDGVFNLEKRLNKALEDDASLALDKLQDTSVVFSHLCHGINHTMGALRLTKICHRANTPNPLIDLIGYESTAHSKLFASHIRRVGREGALLDFLMRYLLKTARPRHARDCGLSAGSLSFIWSTKSTLPFTHDDKGHVVTLSQEMYAALVPSTLTQEYWKALEADDGLDGGDDWEIRMLATKLYSARGMALAILGDNEGSLKGAKNLAEYYTHSSANGGRSWTSNEEARLWYLLGALQTAYMLVHMYSGPNNTLSGFLSCGMIYRNRESSQRRLNHCVGIMTASTIGQPDRQSMLNEMDGIQRTNSVVEAIQPRGTIADLQLEGIPQQMKTADQIVRRRLESLQQEALIPDWPRKGAYWLTNVIEWLRGAVHEGQSLSFCAVLGDFSQISDSGLFEVLTIDSNDNGGLPSPWLADGELCNIAGRDLARLVQQQMAKSNYSWFQEGRYALLWDASLPTRLPKALLALKGSSWDVFINECRESRRPRARKQAALVVYVKSDGSGGVILHGEQLVTFRRNTPWQPGQTGLSAWVTRQITQYVRWLNFDKLEGWARDERYRIVKTVVDAILAVSYDPHMGAMLVFMKDFPKDPFQFHEMGSLWHIRERRDATSSFDRLDAFNVSDLVALMAMDGATCLFSDERGIERVAFGRLVGAGNSSRKKKCGDWNRVLRGEGSRKWNGAMTALRNDVCLVLSISQDGPIYRAGPSELPKDAPCDNRNHPTNCVEIQVSTEVLIQESS